MTSAQPKGSCAARLIWWPLLRGMVTLGLTLTSLVVSIFGLLGAARRVLWTIPIAGALANLVFLPLYALLFAVYGLVFIGLAVVSLLAIRQGLQSARPEFPGAVTPPRNGPRQRVNVRVSNVE